MTFENMKIALVLVVLVSHCLASVPFWRSITRRGGYPRDRVPTTADFAAISFILYYDVGLALELAGYPYVSNHFASLLQADDGTFLLAVFFLAIAPWLFHAGAWLTGRSVPPQPQLPVTGMSRS